MKSDRPVVLIVDDNPTNIDLLVNTGTSTSNALYARYDCVTGEMSLRNTSDTAWLGGYVPATPNDIGNGIATLNVRWCRVWEGEAGITHVTVRQTCEVDIDLNRTEGEGGDKLPKAVKEEVHEGRAVRGGGAQARPPGRPHLAEGVADDRLRRNMTSEATCGKALPQDRSEEHGPGDRGPQRC